MSDDLYIGKSKEQLVKLILGKKIGKRPYWMGMKFRKRAENRYDGGIRIYVRLLDDKEVKEEPEGAFNW